MSVTRYIGQPLAITIAYSSNPLTIYGKDYSDITEVSMNLKKNLKTDADDLYLERTQTDGGVIVDEANHVFTLIMDDYQNLAIDKYHLVLAVQVTGIAEFIELSLSNDSVSITSDKNRA